MIDFLRRNVQLLLVLCLCLLTASHEKSGLQTRLLDELYARLRLREVYLYIIESYEA